MNSRIPGRRHIALAGLAASIVGLAAPVAGALASGAPEASRSTPVALDPYIVLEPLIGEWDVGPAGAPPAFIERFRWGPNRAYVWVSVALLRAPGDEHLHFEGLVMWNAATERFDYLFAVEPGSLTQERGEFHVADDGTIVREVVLTRASGTTANFRQTFRKLGDGRFVTTLMKHSGKDREPTFPGSDNLTMVRRTIAQ